MPHIAPCLHGWKLQWRGFLNDGKAYSWIAGWCSYYNGNILLQFMRNFHNSNIDRNFDRNSVRNCTILTSKSNFLGKRCDDDLLLHKRELYFCLYFNLVYSVTFKLATVFTNPCVRPVMHSPCACWISRFTTTTVIMLLLLLLLLLLLFLFHSLTRFDLIFRHFFVQSLRFSEERGALAIEVGRSIVRGIEDMWFHYWARMIREQKLSVVFHHFG